MRTLKQIDSELDYYRAVASAANLRDSVDNDGRVSKTAAERRANARDNIARLEKERELLARIFGDAKGTR